MKMPFGNYQEDLMQGARNAVGTCLSVRRDERVGIIADRASSAVAASIAEALDEAGTPWNGLLLEEVAPRPWTKLPESARELLETADVGILCVDPQPGELPSRMEMVGIVERRQIR